MLDVILEKCKKEVKRTNQQYMELKMFSQGWSNTSGAREGIGGCMVTYLPTVVVVDIIGKKAWVFFKGMYGYKIEEYNKEFIEDYKAGYVYGMGTNKRFKYGEKVIDFEKGVDK